MIRVLLVDDHAVMRTGFRMILEATGDISVDYLFRALSAGASGFLLKNAGPEELTNAVRVAAAGDALLAPEVTRRVIERFTATPGGTAAGSVDDRTASRDAPGPVTPAATPPAASVDDVGLRDPLTDREREVLRLLAQAMSNAEIAQALFIGEATVKTHVSNILLKLGARDRVAAVVFAHIHHLT